MISQVKLIVKPTQVFNLKKISIQALSKLIGQLFATININNSIFFISKAIQRVITSVIIKKIRFTFTAILATFFTLGDYDPDTLLVMDTETLGDLDYIES